MYKRLMTLCKNKNTTLTTVLKKIKINPSYIGLWKKGKLPNGEQIKKLCIELNVSADYILFGEEIMTTDEIYIKKYKSLNERNKGMIDSRINDLYEEEQEQDEEIYKIKEPV